LAVQILCDQYIALKRGRSSVSLDCPLRVVLEEAKTEAAMLCDAHYQSSPEVALPGQDIPNITLVRPWIHHALVEVLKNAMVSSMKVAEREDTAPPLIQVEIVKDPDFVSILVRDGGTGLADPSRAFTFASSSADQRWDRLDVQQSYAAVRSPLQSLGVGVPCSLWLLQHFGGKLKLANNRGQGCTATLSLPRNDTIPEYLPIDDDDYLLCTDAPS
jgi:pyruvate dehydrogenase kinase 2/3/4